ncbi:PEGA domain-containing protein [Cystobacter fuscus]
MTFSSRFNPVAVVLALALGGMTQAAPRRAVLASGDCKDAALSSQTKALHDTLSARAGEDVLTPADFAERLFPPPSGSLADIQRQFEAARGQFYEARHTRAVQSLGEVLEQVVRLPVGETRWKLFVDTWLLQGMTLRALGRMKESDEAFLNVLRLDAQYQLDPDYYTPSTRQAFDKLRRELARARKVRLSVKSSAPSSEVFLDGRSVGQTPLALEVPPGTYSLTLKKGEAVSFPRQLSVQGEETPVHVDLTYEGAVSATPFPCLATPEEGGEQGLSYAVRLGGTLGVEEVIVVRLEGEQRAQVARRHGAQRGRWAEAARGGLQDAWARCPGRVALGAGGLHHHRQGAAQRRGRPAPSPAALGDAAPLRRECHEARALRPERHARGVVRDAGRGRGGPGGGGRGAPVRGAGVGGAATRPPQ